jgi:hypothetical protein
MELFNFINRNKFQLLFIVFVVSYALNYSFFGYDDADGGYTLALSWRIFNGEIPYKDFILVRPPLSPLFHSLTLLIIPDNYQMIFDRFFCYFLFASSSLLGALTIDKVFNLKELKLNPCLLATIGFVFSVGSFPAMAWHTVDAVFFASIGVFILVCSSSIKSVVLGVFFLFLSALCKQPFYLMPFAGIFFIAFVNKNYKQLVISILSLVLCIGIFLFILHCQNNLENYISLTSGSTELTDLISAGVLSYLNIKTWCFLLPFGLCLVAKKYFEFSKIIIIKENVIPYLFISVVLVFPLLKFIYTLLYNEVSYNYFFRDNVAQLLFIITCFLLLANLSLEKKWVTLLFLIVISWSASISWGYKTPVLFSTPLLFGFLLVSQQFFKIKIGILALYTLFIGSLTYLIAYQKPYCNPLRQSLTYNIGHIFPKMKHINVGKETYDKYKEFSVLIVKYGMNFKTLPGMPLANYLTNTNSPVKIDWIFNAETNNENQNIINELGLKKTIIFVEKSPQLIHVSDSKTKFNSSVTYFIKKNWLKIDSTNYFEIYKKN